MAGFGRRNYRGKKEAGFGGGYYNSQEEEQELRIVNQDGQDLQKHDLDKVTKALNESIAYSVQCDQWPNKVVGWMCEPSGSAIHAVIKLGSERDAYWAKGIIEQSGLVWKEPYYE